MTDLGCPVQHGRSEAMNKKARSLGIALSTLITLLGGMWYVVCGMEEVVFFRIEPWDLVAGVLGH